MARVWDRSKHAGSELLMLLAIADFADDDGRAYPAVPTLAAKCRMTPRNANLILAALRRTGELVIRQNEGPKGTNLYQIIHASTPEAGFTPEERFTLKPTSPTPEAGFLKPLKPASDEPSVNHQEPSLPRNAKNPRRVCSPSASESADDGFASFWKRYPKKVAKPQAVKAWRKTKPTGQLLADLLAGLERHMASADWQKDGGQFIPHPATWLNARRWEDEPDTCVPSGGADHGARPKAGDTRTRHGVAEVFTDGAGWVPA